MKRNIIILMALLLTFSLSASAGWDDIRAYLAAATSEFFTAEFTTDNALVKVHGTSGNTVQEETNIAIADSGDMKFLNDSGNSITFRNAADSAYKSIDMTATTYQFNDDTAGYIYINGAALSVYYDAQAYTKFSQNDAGGMNINCWSDGTANFTFSDPVIIQTTATVEYDAAAYMTITQADGAGVTFDSVSDGTSGFTFSDLVDLQGDLTSDPLTSTSNPNLFLGSGVAGDGSISHAAGNEGYDNIGIGYHPLYKITTGQRNIAIGNLTLDAITDSIRSVAIGHAALSAMTATQGESVAIGDAALMSCTTGYHNTAVGSACFADLTDGYGNVGMGQDAGHNINGDYNVLIGEDAIINNETGDDNIVLGSECGATLTAGSGNILIGRSVDVPAASTNNYLNIADTIYGTIDSSITFLGTAENAELEYAFYNDDVTGAGQTSEAVSVVGYVKDDGGNQEATAKLVFGKSGDYEGGDSQEDGKFQIYVSSNSVLAEVATFTNTATEFQKSTTFDNAINTQYNVVFWLDDSDEEFRIESDPTHGGYVTRVYKATSGTLTGATDTIELNIPSGWIIRAVQLHVKTAVSATGADPDTWDAELNDGAQEEAIASAQASSQNTNVNFFCHADAGYGGTLTDAETDILLTPDDGNFSGGEIEATAYCFGFDTWDNE